jgi:hypothetical protein
MNEDCPLCQGVGAVACMPTGDVPFDPLAHPPTERVRCWECAP